MDYVLTVGVHLVVGFFQTVIKIKINGLSGAAGCMGQLSFLYSFKYQVD